MSTDVELTREWASGNTDAGERLFERHYDAIDRFFSGKLSSGCEDLVQRTFAACLEKRDAIREVSSFRAFLYGVARFELLMELRRRSSDRARDIDLSVSSMHDLDPSPSQLAARTQEQRQLHDALRHIPIDLQMVIELHYWEELSLTEIAEIIEVPPGTVKSRLRRAKEQLARGLSSSDRTP